MPPLAERRLSRMSARVERGAALLDAEIPGWASRIDLDRLEMLSVHDCVLGQLCGHFEDAPGMLGLSRRSRVPLTHGFMAGRLSLFSGRYREEGRALTLLRAAEVLHRRRRADLRRLVAPPRVEVPVLV